MTAKEKANELVKSFNAYTDSNSLTSDLDDSEWHLRNMKHCALKCAKLLSEEIDDCDTEYCIATRETADETTLIVLRERAKYWGEVCKEIELLDAHSFFKLTS